MIYTNDETRAKSYTIFGYTDIKESGYWDSEGNKIIAPDEVICIEDYRTVFG